MNKRFYVVMNANSVRASHLAASTSNDFKEFPRTKDGKQVLIEIHPNHKKVFKGHSWLLQWQAAKLVRTPEWESEESSVVPFTFTLSKWAPPVLRLAVPAVVLVAIATLAGCIVYAGYLQ